MERDKLAMEHDIVAIEMEAVGVWDVLPCIIVKGVTDYADSHKDKVWHNFAAATAASVMKAILVQYNQTTWANDVHVGRQGGWVRGSDRTQFFPHSTAQTRVSYPCYRCDAKSHMLRHCEARETTVLRGRAARQLERRCVNCGDPDHRLYQCGWEDLLRRRRFYLRYY
jgi:hypothetical protein